MTAQHHDVQPSTTADAQSAAPEHTDPLGPITLPMRHKVGLRAMALVGTVGMSALAAAVVAAPDGRPFGTI
ncbi:hypothetical protein ACFWUU_18120 [Kribbella sp. NPDC058693]|uniref:hypothetical protein n=1 Tax=Kribbella sp. NPDC058693 TaxID=3346602 RepID=UPI003665F92E